MTAGPVLWSGKGSKERRIRREKPWGSSEQHTRTSPSTVKIITAAPGGTLSRHFASRQEGMVRMLKICSCEFDEDMVLRLDYVHDRTGRGANARCGPGGGVARG